MFFLKGVKAFFGIQGLNYEMALSIYKQLRSTTIGDLVSNATLYVADPTPDGVSVVIFFPAHTERDVSPNREQVLKKLGRQGNLSL